MPGIVVKADEVPYAGQSCERGRLADGAVAPADVVRVFVVGVLRVVDENIGAFGQIEAGGPPRQVRELPGAERRLVVAEVHERRVAVIEAVADSWPRMTHECGSDLHARQFE